MHNAASCRLHQVFWVLANLHVDVVRSIFVKYTSNTQVYHAKNFNLPIVLVLDTFIHFDFFSQIVLET